MLEVLDELGIADNTIRHVQHRQWAAHEFLARRRHDAVPQREELELGGRVSACRCCCDGPAKCRPASVSNEIVQHNDWLPTFLAAAGEPDIKEKLKRGYAAAGKTFKVHLDGYNLLPYLTGQAAKSERPGFIYFNDDGDLVGLRFDNWKVVFMEQRVPGTLRIWAEPFVALRVPKLFNLRTDPFERADITSNTYYDWFLNHDYLVLASQSVIADFMATFKEFPPRQKAASFTIDEAMDKMAAVGSGSQH